MTMKTLTDDGWIGQIEAHFQRETEARRAS
jgi:hypothetical protein